MGFLLMILVRFEFWNRMFLIKRLNLRMNVKILLQVSTALKKALQNCIVFAITKVEHLKHLE